MTCHSFFTAAWLTFLLAGASSFAQSLEPFEPPAAASVRQNLAAGRRMSDSLKAAHNKALRDLNTRCRSFCDSLITAAGDSIEESQKDLLNRLCRSMAESLTLVKEQNVNSLDSLFHRHSAAVHRMVDQSTASLSNRMERDERIEQLDDSLATLADVFSTNALDRSDSTLSLLVETGENYRDSVAELTRSFIDDRPVSTLILSLGYDSHVTYRGRDNGTSQYAFMPSLSYHHSSGLYATGAASWLSNPTHRWDVLSLSAGYEREVSTGLSLQTSYTHYWFRSDSKQARSVTNNSVLVEATWLLSAFSLDGSGNLDFGTASEFSFDLKLSYHIDCGTISQRVFVTLDPGCSAQYGQQDQSAVVLRKTKGQKAKQATVTTVSTAVSKVFGIMDYQFAVPLTLTYKKIAVIPQFTFDIPCNVIDASSSAPFGSFSMEMTYTF